MILHSTTLLSLVATALACYGGGGTDGGAEICTNYCENSSTMITGDPQQVGDDVTCDSDSCTVATGRTYTSTQSFSINIGGDVGAGEDAIKGGASVGAGWSWSTSMAQSNTYSFTINNGDTGHIVFRPYFQQSCGDLKYYLVDQNGGGDGTATSTSCETDPYKEDTNSCGQTPRTDSTGFADGSFTVCFTGGPKQGQGC